MKTDTPLYVVTHYPEKSKAKTYIMKTFKEAEAFAQNTLGKLVKSSYMSYGVRITEYEQGRNKITIRRAYWY